MLAPVLRDTYDLTLSQTGILLGGSLGGSVLTLVPWGLTADRVGERAVLVLGVGACGVGLLAASQAHDFLMLLVCFLFAGMAGASVQSASGRAVMTWFPAAQRGLALGIRQTSTPIGGFIVALGLPFIVSRGGVGWGIASMGIACLLSAAIAGLVLRGAPNVEPTEVGPPPLRDRRIWALAFGGGLVVAPQMCVVGFTVLFLHEDRGLSAGAAAAALGAMQMLSIVARIAVGRWSDVVGSRIKPLRTISLVISMLTFLTAVSVSAPLVLLIPLLVVTGVLSMSWNGLVFAAVAEVAGHARSGAAIGIQQTVVNGLGALYPPVFGALVGAASWRWGFATVALIPLVGLRFLRT